MHFISTRHFQTMRDAPPWCRLTIFILLLYFSNFLNAQVHQGQFHLGGQFSIYNFHYTNHDNLSVTIQPELGVMLSSQWSLGLGIPFALRSGTSLPNEYRLGISPFLRKYFDLKSGFYAIAQLQAGVQFDLSDVAYPETIWDVQITPSISYFFSPRFAFEAGFGSFTYTNSQMINNGYEVSSNSRKLFFNSVPIFVLRYYFPTKNH